MAWDGIYYGRWNQTKWYPGSDYDHRSKELDGPSESVRPNEPVHVAIVYSSDNSITLYRNGKIYAAPFVPSGPKSAPDLGKLRTFPANTSSLSIGSDCAGDYPFLGEIKEARLYDRALTDLEIAASFAAGQRFWSRPK